MPQTRSLSLCLFWSAGSTEPHQSFLLSPATCRSSTNGTAPRTTPFCNSASLEMYDTANSNPVCNGNVELIRSQSDFGTVSYHSLDSIDEINNTNKYEGYAWLLFSAFCSAFGNSLEPISTLSWLSTPSLLIGLFLCMGLDNSKLFLTSTLQTLLFIVVTQGIAFMIGFLGMKSAILQAHSPPKKIETNTHTLHTQWPNTQPREDYRITELKSYDYANTQIAAYFTNLSIIH
jgi:hypothetical protein